MLEQYVYLLCAYLVGAIPFGLLIARAFGLRDIRQHGSGNIGATNVVRLLGWKAGFWVYLFDIAKGLLPVMFASSVNVTIMPPEYFPVAVGMLAVLGHVFPLWLGFRGGKGVNTALGVVIALMPLAAAIAFGVFLLTLLLTRFVSLGSLLASLALVATHLVIRSLSPDQFRPLLLLLSCGVALLIFFTHRSNLARLRAGTESRFTFRSRKEEA